ncbi:MAG TPA: glycosyltransferase family 4 protein [Terriglobales bacterium]|nr:glycosyltransferase family 4 protein [Terriglobales bacterium]
MRILYCNKYNYPFSGTEAYLFDLIGRMEARGHETALFSMDHGRAPAFSGRRYLVPQIDFKDPNAGFLKKVRMAGHALYSPSVRRAMRRCLGDFSPELAHVRGIYHHLSPSILWELKRQRIPVLYHLNDFKILCPTYNFVADGRPCEECAQGAFHNVVRKGCYNGPRSSAMVLAAEAYLHKWLKTYESCVDLFLAPSEFVRAKLIASGFPAERIETLPHFQVLPADKELKTDEGYVLYFGRLSPEKGAYELVRAMAQLPHIPLVIAGDGPERARLEALTRELNLQQVLFAGMVHGEKLQKLIATCSFSVFPSHAYETLGKSILESYAWGRPVIASDLGSRRELVQHGVTGLLYKDGDREQLAHSIGFLFDRPDLIEKMGANARGRVKNHHDPEQHMEKLLEIYQRLASPKQLLSFPAASQAAAPSRGIRVAFIGGRGVVSKYSGIESYYEQAGHELARLGHDVTVYCRTYFTPAIKTRNGMRVRRLPTIRSKHLETFVHTLLSTAHAMTADYDIVHYHCLGPALFSFLPRLAGKKTVVTVQGLDWQRGKWGWIASRVLHWGEAAAVRLPNATMVVSRTLQQHYRQKYDQETIYVPNGAAVALRRFPRKLVEWDLHPENYVLYLGRLSPEKNCDLLINAFKKVNGCMKLVLAGGSSHSDSYVENLHRHESDQIRFLPWVSGNELDELLSNAAIFVLPSKIEGMSLALLDAMAAGVCVLTSDIPENVEVVEGAGFTFRGGDQADLEGKLDLLIHNPELRRESAKRGRERIQGQYLWPEVAHSIEEAYYNLLGWMPRKMMPLDRMMIRASGISAAPRNQSPVA